MNELKLFSWQKTFLLFLAGLIFSKFPLPGLFVFCFLVVIFDYKSYLLVFLSFVLGIIYFHIFIPKAYYPFNPNFFTSKLKIEGIVRSVDFLPENKQRVYVDNLVINGVTSDKKLVITLDNKDKKIYPGDIIEDIFKIKPIVGLKNKGYFGYSFYWIKKNIFFKSYLKDINIVANTNLNIYLKLKRFLYDFFYYLKTKLTFTLDKVKCREESRAVVLALLLNDKSLFSYERLNWFRDFGIGHTLALSGLHLGIVFSLGWFWTYLVYIFQPKLALLLPRDKLALLIASVFSLFYLILSRAPLSLLRAEIMFLSWAMLLLINRKRFFIDGFFYALIILVLSSPQSIFEISFQLSFLAVLGVFISHKLVVRLKPKNSFYKFCLFIVVSTVFINIFILPLQIYYFNNFYKFAFINLFWIPVISFITLPFGFLSILFLPLTSLSSLFLQVMAKSLDFLFSILDYLAKGYSVITIFPRPDIWIIILFYLFLIFLIFKNKKTIFFIFISFCLFLIHFYSDLKRDKISILDVGQGQAVLVNINKKRFLIDGGGSFDLSYDFGKNVISKIITYVNLPVLDSIFLTHPDIDHLRGLYYILNKFSYKKFYFNGIYPKGKLDRAIFSEIERKKADKFVYLKNNLRVDIDNSSYFYLIYPNKSPFSTKNSSSLVIQMVYKGNNKVLICGDMEKNGLKNLLKRNINWKTPILILPHHGSKSSFSLEFYKQVNPSLAIVSSGFLNPYNLPSSKVVSYFKSKNIKILNTAIEGQIDIFLDRNSWKVKTEKKVIGQQKGFEVDN